MNRRKVPVELQEAYKAMYHARYRCENTGCERFRDYGARGIKFNFESPLEGAVHLGPKPYKGLSLDRIDNNGHYEAGNVRWATASEQQLNSRYSAGYGWPTK